MPPLSSRLVLAIDPLRNLLEALEHDLLTARSDWLMRIRAIDIVLHSHEFDGQEKFVEGEPHVSRQLPEGRRGVAGA